MSRFIVILLLVISTVAVFEISTAPARAASATGIGAWTESTDYGASAGSSGAGGIAVGSQACVTNNGYIYCVGGSGSSGIISKVFFSQLSSSAVGAWTETTDYGASSGTGGTGGVIIANQACVAYNGYIYCVGGVGGSFSSSVLSKVFYAQLSSSGVGAWSETTDYGAASGTSGSGGVRVQGESCVAYNGYIYCVGGFAPGGVSKVFYAQLSSAGVGAWTETIDYAASSGTNGSGGISGDPTCVGASGNIYCVGGITNTIWISKDFYASLSSTGVGAWSETVDYGATSGSTGTGGHPIEGPACGVSGTQIYCVGGYDDPVSRCFYVAYSASGLASWTGCTDYGATSGTDGNGGIMLYNHACIISGQLIVCAGGDSYGGYLSDVFVGTITTTTAKTPTTTTGFCATSSLRPDSFECTAVASGLGGSSAPGPTGAISWATSGTGSFSAGSCTLAQPSGSNPFCTVFYTHSLSDSQANLTASYGGDPLFSASTGTILAAKLNPDDTVQCLPSTSAAGSFICTDTVSRASSIDATGAVSWGNSGFGTFSPSSCTLSHKTCSAIWTPSTSDGVVTITASYGGDRIYLPKSTATTSTPSKTTLFCVYGRTAQPPAYCLATVQGATPSGPSRPGPTGTVRWQSSGSGQISDPSSTCTLPGKAVNDVCPMGYFPSASDGWVTITASYGGDSLYRPSTGSTTITIIATTTASASTSTTTTTSTTTSRASITTSSGTTSSTGTSPTTSATTSSSSSTVTATTSTTSTLTTSPTTTSSAISSGGVSGIPELPAQLGLAILATVVIVASYVLARRVMPPRV
ncbi:MAG: hypothetical protein LYZ70_04355 [Nitrososphaerales archaeon]|nr:hypothetical protein [Nitrososphaerales archaeon]